MLAAIGLGILATIGIIAGFGILVGIISIFVK